MTGLPSGEHGWIIYIAVVLLLGVAGNALWEYLLRPLCARCPRLIWRGLTHVNARLANSIVRQAARRREPALKIVLFVSCLLIASALGAAMGAAGQLIWSPPGWDSITVEYHAAESLPLPKREAALQSLVEHVEAYRTEKELAVEHKIEYPALVVSICLAIILFDAMKVFAAYLMASRFEWVLQLQKRILSEQQIREIEWRWAAMETKEDLAYVWNLLHNEPG